MSTVSRPCPNGQRSLPALVPANGQPLTLAEQIDHEALSYKARGDSFSQFIASHLDRLAQLVRWTGANSPEEHETRMEIWDCEIAARHHDRGYQDGLDAARREYGIRHGFPLD